MQFSVSFLYNLVVTIFDLLMQTMVSRKLIYVLEYLHSNLMVVCLEFSFAKKSLSSCSLPVQITKMSSTKR